MRMNRLGLGKWRRNEANGSGEILLLSKWLEEAMVVPDFSFSL